MPKAVLSGVVVMVLTAPCGAVWAGVHDGGVGSCNICHSMHSSSGSGSGQSGGGRALLAGGPASDICLSCHATDSGSVMSADMLAPDAERGPGNFVFLLEDNLNDGPDGISNPITGDAAGHNVRAPSHGLATDGTLIHSPGGNYPASQLKCTSCHDPHGNANYRFLRGPGTRMGSGGNFGYPAPVAVGLDIEFGGAESNANHVAYQSGMSLWCANCHPDYLNDHNDNSSSFEHPTEGTFDSEQILQYNLYNGTMDPAGGLYATAYLADVPFEDAANQIGSLNGPTATSQLMCLSCHRAHASSAPASGRWDFNVSKLVDDGAVSGSHAIANPYLDPGQDPLCWKCHIDGEQ